MGLCMLHISKHFNWTITTETRRKKSVPQQHHGSHLWRVQELHKVDFHRMSAAGHRHRIHYWSQSLQALCWSRNQATNSQPENVQHALSQIVTKSKFWPMDPKTTPLQSHRGKSTQFKLLALSFLTFSQNANFSMADLVKFHDTLCEIPQPHN